MVRLNPNRARNDIINKLETSSLKEKKAIIDTELVKTLFNKRGKFDLAVMLQEAYGEREDDVNDMSESQAHQFIEARLEISPAMQEIADLGKERNRRNVEILEEINFQNEINQYAKDALGRFNEIIQRAKEGNRLRKHTIEEINAQIGINMLVGQKPELQAIVDDLKSKDALPTHILEEIQERLQAA